MKTVEEMVQWQLGNLVMQLTVKDFQIEQLTEENARLKAQLPAPKKEDK